MLNPDSTGGVFTGALSADFLMNYTGLQADLKGAAGLDLLHAINVQEFVQVLLRLLDELLAPRVINKDNQTRRRFRDIGRRCRG
jgi:hypothetical protein